VRQHTVYERDGEREQPGDSQLAEHEVKEQDAADEDRQIEYVIAERSRAEQLIQDGQQSELDRAHVVGWLVEGVEIAGERLLGREVVKAEEGPVVAIKAQAGEVGDGGEDQDEGKEDEVGAETPVYLGGRWLRCVRGFGCEQGVVVPKVAAVRVRRGIPAGLRPLGEGGEGLRSD
jgi:hypothetical protein